MEELSIVSVGEHERSAHRRSTTVGEKLFFDEDREADDLETEIDSPYRSEPVPRGHVDADDIEKPATLVRPQDEYTVPTQEEAGFPGGKPP